MISQTKSRQTLTCNSQPEGKKPLIILTYAKSENTLFMEPDFEKRFGPIWV